jgi:myo-inositol-1(or 4)-monophosphatase
LSAVDHLEVAIEVAHEAGALLRAHLHEPLHIREKGLRADLVTAADDHSERLILERLRREYPSATILSEESGVNERGISGERWIVDPLDGTTNFAHGYPLFCISIAYEKNGELLAAVVHAPLMNETFAAQHGAGAFVNGQPIRVSRIERLKDAMSCTGFQPARYERNAREFAAISNVAQAVRRDGAAALDLAYVACGRFDGFWEYDLHAWDVAAGTLLIREAGGRVTTIESGETSLDAGSILATNGRLHDELRAALLSARSA